MPNSMTSQLVRKSALERFWGKNDHASLLAGNVALRELPHLGVIKLQCRSASAEFLATVKSVLSVELPLTPNTRTGESPCALWLAPNDWLVVTEADEDVGLAAELEAQLAQALPHENTAVTVITDSLVVLGVAGRAAADLIAKGCGLDLHPASFPARSCASSLLEQVPIVIYPEDEQIAYRIFVERSHAAFSWDWLCHAAKEFEYYP